MTPVALLMEVRPVAEAVVYSVAGASTAGADALLMTMLATAMRVVGDG